MKFLILAALVAVAAARPQNYEDGVFRFSSNVNPTGFERSSVQRTFVKEVQPSYVVKSAPVVSQYVQKVHVAEPVYSQVHHHVVNQPAGLVRTVEEEVPAVTSVHHVQQPAVFSQVSNVHHHVVPTTSVVASRSSFAPLQYTTNQYSNQYTNQYTNQYSTATPVFKILKQVQDVDPSGNYHINYETENGITLNEQGTLKDIQAKEGPVAAKEGSYSYTGPDGVVYTVNYIADEYGFRASGAHLPVAPEIPAEIQRSLELIASQPEKYDEDGNLISRKF